MAHHPFSSGNSLYSLESIFNERAAPRRPDSTERFHRHAVVPISSSDTPHYAQASHLYPMRTSSDIDNIYRYKPGSQLNNSGSSGQAIFIPVVHVSATRGPGTPSQTSHSSDNSDSNPSTPQPDGGENSIRSPTFRTSSHMTTGSRTTNRTTPLTDPEAEVDALTNLLMQSMETRSSAGTMGSSGILKSSSEATNSSPVGSLRRGSGMSSQLGRLQQRVGYSTGTGVNGGRGSPSTTAVTGASAAGSSSTNSPTDSVLGTHTSSDSMGSSMANQNICFRCYRPLLPPEGSTLNPSLSSVNSSSNVVTLTGALGVRLHVACFACYQCAAPLKSDAYYHNLGRLLCPACVRDGAVKTCSNCHRPIGDRVVHALGMHYHPNCFVCVVCAGRLDSRPFTIDVHGRLHCLMDFHRRYAPRCVYCGKPIVPEPGCQEARRVVSGNANYHLECFHMQTLPQKSNLKPSGFKISGVAG